MREISRTTISSRSPRQMISLSCVRTAGVGSTGMNAAGFTAGVSKSVASVACVASVECVASVASVASRSVASAFVASVASVASQFTVPGASRSSPLSPVAFSHGASSSRQLRQVVSRSSQSSALVSRRINGPSVTAPRANKRASTSVSNSSIVSSGVRVGCVESSPKLVLRQAFQKSFETARDSLCRRLSRRFAGSPSCSESKAQSGRVASGSVALGSVASASSFVASGRVMSSSVASRSVH